MSRMHAGDASSIVGGGFAGLGCAARAGRPRRRARSRWSTATTTTSSSRCSTRWRPSQLARGDVAFSLRELFRDARQRRRGAGRGRLGRPAGALRDHGRRADLRPATSWCWRPARSRTSSTPRAPPSTRSRSTRSTTPSGCAPASSTSSRTADRDPELVDEGALTFVDRRRRRRPASRSPGALAELIHDTMPPSTRTSPCRPPRSCWSTSATRCWARSRSRPTSTRPSVLRARRRRAAPGDRRSTEVGPGHVDARRRHDDHHPLRHLGRRRGGRAAGRPQRAADRAAAGASTSSRTSPSTGYPGVYVLGDLANIPVRRRQVAAAARLGRAAVRAVGGATTSSPTSRASRAGPSTTRTRASWR